MDTKTHTEITEYNTKALKEISKHLAFSDWQTQPVMKKITYQSFAGIGYDLHAILEAIEFIGFNGQKEDLSTCAGLAKIAQKLIPNDELSFLDQLLIKEDSTKNDFIKLKTTNNE